MVPHEVSFTRMRSLQSFDKKLDELKGRLVVVGTAAEGSPLDRRKQIVENGGVEGIGHRVGVSRPVETELSRKNATD